MKPFRGKRTGPQSRPGDSTRWQSLLLLATGPVRAEAASRLGRGCTSPGRAPGPVGWRPDGRGCRWPPLRRGCLAPRTGPAGRPRDRSSRPAGHGAVSLTGGFDWHGTVPQCRPTALFLAVRASRAGSSGSPANLSAPRPTRLETRTKESNMCASHWALRNPQAE